MSDLMCKSCGKELTLTDKLRTKKHGYCYDCGIAEPARPEPPPEPHVASPPEEQRRLSATRAAGWSFRPIGFALVGAALLAFIGSFLPWAEALGGLVTANGTDGDGIMTLVVALIGGGLGLGIAFGRRRSTALWTGLGAFVCGGIMGAVTAYDLNNLNNVIEEIERESPFFDPGLSAGSGLYLTLVAGIVMALASVVAILTARDQAVAV